MQNQVIIDGFNQGIEALGECASRDAAADLIRTAGITGRRVDPWGCLVARWLSSCAGAPVTVGTSEAGVYAGDKEVFRRLLPEAAMSLINAFDGGLYPDLEDRSR